MLKGKKKAIYSCSRKNNSWILEALSLVFNTRNTHLTKLLQALFAGKMMFFCVFSNKTDANISTGRGNKSFCSKAKKKKGKKENTSEIKSLTFV